MKLFDLHCDTLYEMHKNEAVDYLTLMPVYLRAPQAERERARKLGGQA